MKTTVREGCVPDDTRTYLTRRDVASAAACVQACNDGGVHDELLAKLRGLFVLVRDAGEIVLPEVSVKAGESAGHLRAKGRSDSESGAPSQDGRPLADEGSSPSPKTTRDTSGASRTPSDSPADAGYPSMRELEYEPGAPDTVVVDETAVEDLAKPTARASTVAAVAEGVARAERDQNVEPDLTFRPRRVPTTGPRRRTKAMNE